MAQSHAVPQTDKVTPMTEDQKPEMDATAVGVGVALGAGLGSVLFAITDSPVWIGVGTAIGAALGAAWNSRNQA